jgi:thiamine biosynthesis lipoprotein
LAEPDRPTAWEWQATGTVWRIHHDGCVDAALARRASAAVEVDEARWSRFRPDSEVNALNAAAGRPVPVSDETLALLEACGAWRARTGGVFDPLVGRALVDWGYAEGLQAAAPFAAASPDAQATTGVLALDRARRTATVPAGERLDLGGIGKGWMADRLAALLADALPAGRILVDAGGDLVAARGAHELAVEGAGEARLLLAEGLAVATSGSGERRWRNGDGRLAHHLIDPRTGAPGVESQATVVASSAAEADVLAKTLALRPGLIAELATPARVEADGVVRTTAAWDAALVQRVT